MATKLTAPKVADGVYGLVFESDVRKLFGGAMAKDIATIDDMFCKASAWTNGLSTKGVLWDDLVDAECALWVRAILFLIKKGSRASKRFPSQASTTSSAATRRP